MAAPLSVDFLDSVMVAEAACFVHTPKVYVSFACYGLVSRWCLSCLLKARVERGVDFFKAMFVKIDSELQLTAQDDMYVVFSTISSVCNNFQISRKLACQHKLQFTTLSAVFAFL